MKLQRSIFLAIRCDFSKARDWYQLRMWWTFWDWSCCPWFCQGESFARPRKPVGFQPGKFIVCGDSRLHGAFGAIASIVGPVKWSTSCHQPSGKSNQRKCWLNSPEPHKRDLFKDASLAFDSATVLFRWSWPCRRASGEAIDRFDPWKNAWLSGNMSIEFGSKWGIMNQEADIFDHFRGRECVPLDDLRPQWLIGRLWLVMTMPLRQGHPWMNAWSCSHGDLGTNPMEWTSRLLFQSLRHEWWTGLIIIW